MIILLIFLLIIFGLIWWVSDHQSYFKKRNVKYFKSPPFLGFITDNLLGRKSPYDNYSDIYNRPEFKDEPFFGIFMFHKPALMIKDPDLIKKIMVTDFHKFGNRHAGSDVHDPIGYYQLFMAKYQVWKIIRAKISPFFSSAKLKSNFHLIDKLGNDLNQYIMKRLKNGRVELEAKPLVDLFFVDVVTSVAFGVEAHSLEYSGSEFQVAANAIFKFSVWRGFELISNFLLPSAMKFFDFKNLSHYTVDFIYRVCPKIMEEREKSGRKRNDLIDTLIELKSELKPEYEGHTVEDMLYAQVGIFLAAGYETSSTTTLFTLYQLSVNEDIQSRLRNEIKEMLFKSNGRISYEAVANPSELPYLHQVVNETFRMYPVLPALDRECIDPNGVSLEPFSDFKIPFGMPILIPIYALERDEKYFESPLTYNPDRFSAENIKNIPSNTFIPFGIGPRSCIGERMGLIQTKTAICSILKDFRVATNERTPKEIKLKINANHIQSEDPIYLDFVKDSLYVENNE